MTPAAGRRRVGILLFDHVKTLDFVGPGEVFVEANQRVDDGYDLVLLSVDGHDVTTSMGVRIGVHSAAAGGGNFDTVIIPCSEQAPRVFQNDEILDVIVDLASRTRRMTSICSGAFALAAAGLLVGRSVTTHWKFAAVLASTFPDIDVQPDLIFIRDGDIYTSAGVAAGIDLALALVEDDHGAGIARAVAQLLLVYMQRAGGQSQFSASLKALPPRTPLVREVFEYINADPTRPATLSRLSAHVHVSPRHLTRLVKDELGVTPLEYIASVRVDLATGYLESGATVAHASHRAGFTSPAAFRRAFKSRRGVMPSVYQHHFRTTNRSLTS